MTPFTLRGFRAGWCSGRARWRRWATRSRGWGGRARWCWPRRIRRRGGGAGGALGDRRGRVRGRCDAYAGGGDGAGLAAFRASGADCVVALGGGSTIGLGKAIAVRTGADQVVIPTTYAGSEMTDILGETEGGRKTTRRDPAIRPEVVVYDVDLTLTLPPAMTVTSALNAVAHAVEGLYAPDRNPILSLMAVDGCRAIARSLRAVVDGRRTRRRGATCSMARGCVRRCWATSRWRCITSWRMCWAGRSGRRMRRHAILLPHTAGFNAGAVPELLAPVAEVFGGSVGGACGISPRGAGRRCGWPIWG